MNNDNLDQKNYISLADWAPMHDSMEEKREFLLNADIALKYLNSNGMRVDSFDFNDIFIVDGNLREIKYNVISNVGTVTPADVKSNIYEESKMALYLYLYPCEYIDDNFLKKHFTEFSFAFPSDDVPYYKGIFERGASVPFSDFDFQKRKMELEKLSDATKKDGDSDLMGDIDFSMLSKPNNDEINKKLYREAAFAKTIALSTIISVVGFLICLIALFMHFN